MIVFAGAESGIWTVDVFDPIIVLAIAGPLPTRPRRGHAPRRHGQRVRVKIRAATPWVQERRASAWWPCDCGPAAAVAPSGAFHGRAQVLSVSFGRWMTSPP